MLRNRSRAVTSNKKQALMADHSTSSISTTQNYTTTIPCFFDSSRFKLFTSKPLLPEINSPTSILDCKPFFFPFGNPFAFDHVKSPKSPKFFSPNSLPETLDQPKGIALANQIEDESSSCVVASNNRKVLFGTELRVQIPPLHPPPSSPADYGIKTGNSHSSPPFGSPPPVIFNGSPLPVKEMELSEDYTCVTSHGPNPKTTHIFDNFVLENYCCSANNTKPKSAAPESNFLSFCHTCKKNLEHKGIDIYIYRGEKAFCSQECRYQEMILDGEDN